MAVLTSTSVTGVTTMSIAGDLTVRKYADTVVAGGNTGTALTLDLNSGCVFTATLTGNATITFQNASTTTAWVVILTNDGTAGRTVAWAYSGGTFRWPGGSGSLSRTTTANAIDVWTFFTTNGGTNITGNIALKNLS